MWKRLNTLQRRIVIAAALLLSLMILFPPVYREAVITGLRSSDGAVGFELRDFAGWGFIGQKNLTVFAGKRRLKDPDKMNLAERWEFMAGQSLDELRSMPSLKVAYGVFSVQVLALLIGVAAALYFAKDTAR